MRDRILVVLVSLAVGIVAVFIVERAYTTSSVVRAHEQANLGRTTAVAAAMLAERDGPVTREVLEKVVGPHERATYVAADGREVVTGDDTVAADGGLTATRSVGGAGTLTVVRDADAVEGRVADSLFPLTLTGLGVVVMAVFLGLGLSRRMSRPFLDLARSAERIGRGEFSTPVPRSTLPEADAVARALRSSAEDLDQLVRREREFAAHASHELRTPITAVRLELEDLLLSRNTPREVAVRLTDALGQLDRLSATVGRLLDSSRRERLGSRVEIDLVALVCDTVDRWREIAPDRLIRARVDGSVPLRIPAGSLLEVMDVLLGNAVLHGEGRIDVSLAEHAEYVEVAISDEGDRERAVVARRETVRQQTGGLVTAGEIAAALGGHLRLSEAPRTTFSLVLPRAPRENLST